MKTKPMTHQLTGCARLATSDIFAMGAEQGTGKTWMLLADAECRWKRGEIDAMVIIAPNGVHMNWIVREIPRHLGIPHTATFWVSGASKRHMATLDKQVRQIKLGNTTGTKKDRKLHIFAINVDAINTKSGYEYTSLFISLFKFRASKSAVSFNVLSNTDIIVDESHIIKNPNAKRTERVIELGRMCCVRRISSGTLVANSPLDLFSQFDFLAPGLLGTRSYRAFVAEYADLLPEGSPLIQDIIRRTGARGAPQIVARNKDGTLRFRNLDKLSGLMAPHTFRVTKDECLDLPDKIYQTHYFDLLPNQRKAYEHVVNERNWLKDGGEIDTFTALTVITKLRQITSGFILSDGEPTSLVNAAPRMAALEEAIAECSGPVIIWASFQEEIRQIAAMLKKAGEEVREYHGGTKRADRTAAIDDFQSGVARFFVGNPAAAGTGLTLTAAETAIYYSCDFSLSQRLQSEDRCHRIGTTKHVVYIDIVGRKTIDERIAHALQTKKATAQAIMEGL